MSYQKILDELRGHLERAQEWAHPDDLHETDDGWSCIKSTLRAVKDGDVGLALTRWGDLSSPGAPRLSSEADAWRACPGYMPYSSRTGPHGKSCECPHPADKP